MSNEVMKQALEALEKAKRQCQYHNIAPHLAYDDAITSLRQAIQEEALRNVQRLGQEIEAEAEQEFVCSTGLCRYRKPLTSEQIKDLVVDHIGMMSIHGGVWRVCMDVARAIEAAHGIKG